MGTPAALTLADVWFTSSGLFAWLAPLPLADSTKVLSRVFLRSFLENNRRYHWVAGIPAAATIYPDEIF